MTIHTSIQTAASDLVTFMDDDCLLAETWLTEADRFGQLHPKACHVHGNSSQSRCGEEGSFSVVFTVSCECGASRCEFLQPVHYQSRDRDCP